jgi:hypothetical protein
VTIKSLAFAPAGSAKSARASLPRRLQPGDAAALPRPRHLSPSRSQLLLVMVDRLVGVVALQPSPLLKSRHRSRHQLRK